MLLGVSFDTALVHILLLTLNCIKISNYVVLVAFLHESVF